MLAAASRWPSKDGSARDPFAGRDDDGSAAERREQDRDRPGVIEVIDPRFGTRARGRPASPPTRTTSESSAACRAPPGARSRCTTRSIASASCSRIASWGRPTPAISASVSIRRSASSARLACTVDSAPSWPVFSATSRSSASAPRTSPITIRSGRIRSALRSRSRIVTSPDPRSPAGRLSSRTTCGWRRRSSAASSIVITRSPGSMKRGERVEQGRLARSRCRR